ncbi:unnamed protein product [Rhizoctonia solani]|uniref:Laminin domain protein n=1 Tax=Rhizoctonia solani TaxID=456999 RepID=A0A8H3B2L4_9AGAM|nr:unnamed protein product [Rhizoctonia solani]
MSRHLAEQIFSPPELPLYLKRSYDLKPFAGVPSDEEVIGIHTVIRVAQKVVGVPGMGNPTLLYQLSEHLFNAQMSKYRSRYQDAIFPENIIYTPPTLPAHVFVSLEPVAGTPSDEEIIRVQDAIRSYQQFSNAPPMFNSHTNMELSQHLFDLQIANYTRRVKQRKLVSHETCSPRSPTVVEPAEFVDESNTATNNAGTGGKAVEYSELTRAIHDVNIQDAIERSNRLAERANQLIEHSNQIAERSNQIAERSNQLVEQSRQQAQQSKKAAEWSNQLLERSNQHHEQSNQRDERINHLVEKAIIPVDKIADTLRNINKVLVGIQHAIVRNSKGNTIYALNCLVNEKGETPAVTYLSCIFLWSVRPDVSQLSVAAFF